MEKETKNRTAIVILSLVFLTIVLVLEIIPYLLGMVFTRVDESNQVVNVVKYSSYFDVLPIGYALFTQFLSSLTTIACIVLFIIRIFKPYKNERHLHIASVNCWLIIHFSFIYVW